MCLTLVHGARHDVDKSALCVHISQARVHYAIVQPLRMCVGYAAMFGNRNRVPYSNASRFSLILANVKPDETQESKRLASTCFSD